MSDDIWGSLLRGSLGGIIGGTLGFVGGRLYLRWQRTRQTKFRGRLSTRHARQIREGIEYAAAVRAWSLLTIVGRAQGVPFESPLPATPRSRRSLHVAVEANDRFDYRRALGEIEAPEDQHD